MLISVVFNPKFSNSVLLFRYDPSLTYGRVKQYAVAQFTPHFVLYDKKCLTFQAFFKQSVFESPDEHYRVRQVNIVYFLEDDTITVMEPLVDVSFTWKPCYYYVKIRFLIGSLKKLIKNNNPEALQPIEGLSLPTNCWPHFHLSAGHLAKCG